MRQKGKTKPNLKPVNPRFNNFNKKKKDKRQRLSDRASLFFAHERQIHKLTAYLPAESSLPRGASMRHMLAWARCEKTSFFSLATEHSLRILTRACHLKCVNHKLDMLASRIFLLLCSLSSSSLLTSFEL